ncbi:uncharacterized protein LOC119923564 [Tachyglossus aculeatus]|uniref:uncharacterized protein LOC119923564 n=1 Tax=Tachyglossus aculeatus TaxID=9261 RepID=UPI0018F4E4F7|nr:uncharacterized protein LOC119923564 [Tachyglossus aculeatus]
MTLSQSPSQMEKSRELQLLSDSPNYSSHSTQDLKIKLHYSEESFPSCSPTSVSSGQKEETTSKAYSEHAQDPDTDPPREPVPGLGIISYSISPSFSPPFSAYLASSSCGCSCSVTDILAPSDISPDEERTKQLKMRTRIRQDDFKQPPEFQMQKRPMEKHRDIPQIIQKPQILFLPEVGDRERGGMAWSLKPSQICGSRGWPEASLYDPITLLETNIRQKYLAFLLGLHDPI